MHVAVPNGNNQQETTELFSFGRPKEEKLKSHHHPQRKALAITKSPFLRLFAAFSFQSTQSTGGSTRSTGGPYIANESPAASASVRGIRRRSGNEPSTSVTSALWGHFPLLGQGRSRRSAIADLVPNVLALPPHRSSDDSDQKYHQLYSSGRLLKISHELLLRGCQR
ncbi:hypothetical protein Taro_044236 [Colocasia esculenta]|uniref:Uncharacterized protein n=1 Tax=Colocasia esculenta TaxID=4460 RepID=A0A843X0E6_COLES|nr:hypothetical protein [Colocasia esculenta]